MRRVRCSSLPLYFACGGAQFPATSPVTTAGEGAALGTAAHEAWRRHFSSGGPLDLGAVAMLHGVDVKELGVLFALGLRMWEELRPQQEQELGVEEDLIPAQFCGGLVLLTGTVDLLWQQGRIGYVLDWKTGRRDSDCREQVLGYAGLILSMPEHETEIDEVVARIAWVRDQEIETYRLHRNDLPAWRERITKMLTWEGVYRPGEHCSVCKRQNECEAKAASDKALVQAFGAYKNADVEMDFARLPPERAVELYHQAKQVWALADQIRQATRARVEREGQLAGHGKVLTMQPYEVRELDTLKAWPVLSQRLSDEELAQAAHVSIADIEDIVAKRAGHGHGAQAKREIVGALDEVGAIERRPKKKLSERRE